MKKYGQFILIAIFIIIIIIFIPAIQGLFEPEAPSSVYQDFGAFIPYTIGYFPEGFSITTAGTDSHREDTLDRFEEWYGSENYFIQLIQDKGKSVELWDQGYAASRSLLVQDQPAEIKIIEDPSSWVSEGFDLSKYDVSQSLMLTFFIDDLRIQVVSNLPENEIIQVAENLIPSICLNPTQESP